MKVGGKVPKGVTILEAARSLGVAIEGPCGGTGRCGKDLVQVRTGETLHTVLACKTPVETNLEVIFPSCEKKTMKIVEGFYAKGDRACDIDPFARKELMQDEQGLCFPQAHVNGDLLFAGNGNTKGQTYGIAIDMGTTTLVASLVDLTRGAILGSSSALNPLVYYGHDIMSRIKYSTSRQDGLLRMHRELISTVNLLIRVLSCETSVRPENIYQIIGAGNTTMQHIFLNKEIKGIGEYPYRAETLDICTATAQALFIDIAAHAPVMTFPCISAYVGGDIVSGLLAVDVKSLELPALFLDIGTNGEIALILNDSIVASSTAAGPCFEGMTISSGMMAGEGAIEHVRFGDELSLEVIGAGTPKGICGSGLLDLASELVRIGLVNSRGRLQAPEDGNNPNPLTATKSMLPCNNPISPLARPTIVQPNAHGKVKGNERRHSTPLKYQKNLFEKEGKRFFRLTDMVSISQEDIRQIQLAKAAIRAGIEILLAKCNVKAEELRTIVIAGGFGYHLSEKALFGIGILPKATHAQLSFVGNSSLAGAVRTLFNKEQMHHAAQIARTAQVMELSQIPEFDHVFIREMSFLENAR